MSSASSTLAPGERRVRVNGVELWYRVAGRGPVVVLQAPGWGVGSGLYQGTMQALERACTVVYYDPRASGESEVPSDLDQINVGAFMEDLDALRDHLGLASFALLGHSHGGYIAMNYAVAYPDRLSALLLVDAQVGADEPGEELSLSLPRLAEDGRFAEALAAFTAPTEWSSDDGAADWLHRVLPLYFADPEGQPLARARAGLRSSRVSLAALRGTQRSDALFPVRDKLARITTPTLVLAGRHDFICAPAQPEIIHGGIRGSTLTWFERSGHFPWLEEPDRFFAEVAGFVGRHGRG
jgi:proline iminopeptidase